MWKMFKRFMVAYYIYLARVRFYPSQLVLSTPPFKSLVVGTNMDYTMTFHFHYEHLFYLEHYRRRPKKLKEDIMAVSMVLDEAAPANLRRFQDITYYVHTNPLTLWGGEMLQRILLESFIDNMTVELSDLENKPSI